MFVYADESRPVTIGKYMVKKKATVRKAAEVFHVSKSTVHKDMREKLPQLDVDLYYQVSDVLALNKRERHLRGGDATRKKYARLKSKRVLTVD